MESKNSSDAGNMSASGASIQAPTRRSFLYAAVVAGVTSRAAAADRIHVVEESQREFEYEGCPATEFVVRPETVGPIGDRPAGAIELADPITGESIQVPLFDLSRLTKEKFESGLRASVQAHGNWHRDQGQTAPPIHVHLIYVAGYPDLRALLVHPRHCVLR